MNQKNNIRMIQEVANGLGPLCEKVVFVGGATTSLYIDDPAAPEPSASDDVDLVIEIATSFEYHQFEKELTQRGFKHPISLDGERVPVCRKYYKDIQVDVMPTNEKILGFSNRWYTEAIAAKVEKELSDGVTVFVFSPAYFLASKLAAFEGRSPKDIRLSQDLEDIFAVLDGCALIEDSLKICSDDARKYVNSIFKKLLKDESLLHEAVTGAFGMGVQFQLRADKVIDRMKKILKI